MKMQISAVNNDGGKGSLNVFAQLAEPKTKDGIWIKTEGKVVEIGEYTILKQLPYKFYSGSVVTVSTDIYILGSPYGSKNNYKYDILTDTYIKKKDIPSSFYNKSAVVIGTDIYLFACGDDHNMLYKYDTLTDTYTKLANIPIKSTGEAIAVVVGTDIYLFAKRYSDYKNIIYKYDTLTNTYTNINNQGNDFIQGAAVAIGTDIFLFGAHKTVYKYDTLTDTYMQLTDIPYDFSKGETVSIGTDIYLLGGTTLYKKYAYKYNILNDTYTKLTNIPFEFEDSSATVVGTDIYLFGSYISSYIQYAYKYITSVEYEEISKYDYNKLVVTPNMPTTPESGNIYAIYGNTYEAKILEQLILRFASIFLYKDGETQLYPIYHGNGQEWVKVLN